MKPSLYAFFLFFFSLNYSVEINAQDSTDIVLSNQEYFHQQKKYILKTNIFSPMLGNIKISLERCLSARRTMEYRVAMVTPNNRNNFSSGGLSFSTSYKFFTSPIHSKMKGWTVPIVQGFYIQPEFLFGFQNRLKYNTINTTTIPFVSPKEKQNMNYQMVIANFGLQTLIRKKLVVDLFLGIGFGRDNLSKYNTSADLIPIHSGILKFQQGISLAGKLGIRMGLWIL